MNRYSPKHLLQQKKTVITAHSGCEGTPDNSREHILAAIASGAEMIEVDVRQAPDGTLILSHDVPEDISVRVTLRELFELIEPEKNMEMNLDVKTSGLVEPVMALAKEFDLAGRILFTGECNDDRALAVSLGAEVWHGVWPGPLAGVPQDQLAEASARLVDFVELFLVVKENAAAAEIGGLESFRYIVVGVTDKGNCRLTDFVKVE